MRFFPGRPRIAALLAAVLSAGCALNPQPEPPGISGNGASDAGTRGGFEVEDDRLDGGTSPQPPVPTADCTPEGATGCLAADGGDVDAATDAGLEAGADARSDSG